MGCALEKRLDQKVKDEVLSRGGWIVKIHGSAFMPKGLPDLLICYKGRFIAIESKSAEGTASALQKATIERIKKAGGYACTSRSLKDVQEILDRIDREDESLQRIRNDSA